MIRNRNVKCFVFSLVIFFSADIFLYAAAVTLQGRKLIVDGSEFTVKGVCYSPVPAGSFWTYVWADVLAEYENDLKLIKAIGANTIRTYHERNISRAFLDEAAKNGIYVIAGWGEPLWNKDFSDPLTRASMVAQFETFVNTWKDHPAILMWCFGNEVEEHTVLPKSNWYKLLQEAAIKAHQVDPNHLIITANQEVSEVGSSDPSILADDASLSALDAWGVNVYHGESFESTFFSNLLAKTTKPYLLTEWGCDAFSGISQKEDQVTQDSYIRQQWAGIKDNLANQAGTKACIGGLVFEWCDEWWKGSTVPGNPATIGTGGVNGLSYQDTISDWENLAYSDPQMNEEWWGITSIVLGKSDRSPRLACYSLSKLWGGAATLEYAGSSDIIIGEIKNYPNPFVLGTEPTRILFVSAGSPELEVSIFDLTGSKICDLKEIRTFGLGMNRTDWSGKDSDGNYVPAGLYVCRIKAKTSESEEVQYRKIAVVK